MFRPKNLAQYNEWYWDNFKFIIHEMFLYLMGLLFKHERFELALQLMLHGYYVGAALDNSREPMQQFGIIRQYMASLKYRNTRLKLNRLSLRADLLEQRSHASGLAFVDLMQADFILFFFDAITSHRQNAQHRWWPETLLYYPDYSPPFELFARAESSQFFQKLCPLIAVKSKTELEESFALFGYQNTPLYVPHWEHRYVSLKGATNFEKLATNP